jgi:DNA modification methylase
MGFSYHPPTRAYCEICKKIEETSKIKPAVSTHKGKASSANSFPIHNWYNFVLGYSPEYPDYIIEREKIKESQIIADPFMGSGTTLVACKIKGIKSIGVDANDYFVDVAKAKTEWSLALEKLEEEKSRLLQIIERACENIEETNETDIPLFSDEKTKNNKIDIKEYASKHRPPILPDRYISDIPFVKAHIIKEVISQNAQDKKIRAFFDLAVASILVPISNIRYGPGFGVAKSRNGINVLKIFKQKMERMVSDLKVIPPKAKKTPTTIKLGDSRQFCKYAEENSIDLMITSPPYPGDHEYTKHTKLELIFMGYSQTLKEFRVIKERMIRGSTTNIYKGDKDSHEIRNIESIIELTNEIDKRLHQDGATSGFEKLYTKVIWEYFGGMYKTLNEVYKTLKKGGKICLLISDSHAFKMVHIQTAELLAEIGKKAGFQEFHIELWQNKTSTSHKYNIRENILTLIK